MRNLFNIFRKAPPEWHSQTRRVFKDSAGNWYRRYEDEMQIPIQRMERLHIITREIGNRVTDGDLNAFLDNHEKILLGDKPADEKLRLLIQHTTNLRNRTEHIAAPEMLMRLVCALYIREDQDPHLWDEALEDAKYDQLMKDQKGKLALFFSQAGLKEYLPSPDNLRSGTEKLLKQSQELLELGRKQEAEIAAASS
jgi:hypothetical protein